MEVWQDPQDMGHKRKTLDAQIHFSDLSITVILNLHVFFWFMQIKVPHSTLKLKYLMCDLYL